MNWYDKYDTLTSKALDHYCNEKGIRRGMMTDDDREKFVDWLAEYYLFHWRR